jgi:hypothetical protein
VRRLPVALLAFGLALAGANVHADYAKGRSAFVKGDYAIAGAEFEAAAKVGSVQAMAALGSMYAEGLGVERDDQRAFEWYLRAAEGGNITAQGVVARLYSTGQGTPKNDANALLWARRAAEKGDAESQYIMGVRHAGGLGVKRDSGEALLWFGAAAEQGLVRAQYGLGFLLAQGAAAAKDPTHSQRMRLEAYKWLLIAQRAGDAGAAKGVAAVKALMSPAQIAEAEKNAAEFELIHPYASPKAPQGKP